MDESGNRKKHGQTTPYKIVGKLVTVIAGILIALFVNSIQEKRADKKNLAETLHALSISWCGRFEIVKHWRQSEVVGHYFITYGYRITINFKPQRRRDAKCV